MNAFIEKKHGNYTLMLGLANAFVASTTFTHVGLPSPQPPQKQADHGEGKAEAREEGDSHPDQRAEARLEAVLHFAALEQLSRHGPYGRTNEQAGRPEEDADDCADNRPDHGPG